MPSFVISDLIDRARTYLDDDHDEDGAGGALLEESDWLNLFNVEYRHLYSKWVRAGLVVPLWADTAMTSGTLDLTASTGFPVFAIIGVARDYGGGSVRVLTPAQSPLGVSPFWGSVSSGEGEYWYVTGGLGANITVKIEPVDTSGSYFVRWVPGPATPTDITTTQDVPFGADERLVLGMVKRAGVKEGTRKSLVEDLIREEDALLNFQAFGQTHDGPRVRRVFDSAAYSTPIKQFQTNPMYWRWF